eukprot:3158449-Rhodomonas_salina.1
MEWAHLARLACIRFTPPSGTREVCAHLDLDSLRGNAVDVDAGHGHGVRRGGVGEGGADPRGLHPRNGQRAPSHGRVVRAREASADLQGQQRDGGEEREGGLALLRASDQRDCIALAALAAEHRAELVARGRERTVPRQLDTRGQAPVREPGARDGHGERLPGVRHCRRDWRPGDSVERERG